jgi:hypothetical protein
MARLTRLGAGPTCPTDPPGVATEPLLLFGHNRRVRPTSYASAKAAIAGLIAWLVGLPDQRRPIALADVGNTGQVPVRIRKCSGFLYRFQTDVPLVIECAQVLRAVRTRVGSIRDDQTARDEFVQDAGEQRAAEPENTARTFSPNRIVPSKEEHAEVGDLVEERFGVVLPSVDTELVPSSNILKLIRNGFISGVPTELSHAAARQTRPPKVHKVEIGDCRTEQEDRQFQIVS